MDKLGFNKYFIKFMNNYENDIFINSINNNKDCIFMCYRKVLQGNHEAAF